MRFKLLYVFIFVIMNMFSFLMCSVYEIGDQISLEDQNIEFDICYGAEKYGYGSQFIPKLSLGDFNGYTNDIGVFYVLMIDMAASW